MNLSNFLEVPKGESWAYDYSPAHIDAIAEAGFDTLRLPINAGSHWNGYALDADFAKRIKSVVSRAHEAGLFVVVDLHHYDSFIENPTARRAEFLAIWTELSQMFAGQNGLAFELLNEPSNKNDQGELLEIYDEALSIIRRTHPDAWVIFGGIRWNGLDAMLQLPRPSDPRVAHTFHYYAPRAFTHQQAPWHANPLPPSNWGTDSERTKVTSDMARAGMHHTPVFLGEFGAILNAPGGDRESWLAHVRGEAERVGISWCHWGFGARFRAYDPGTETWDQAVLRALMD